MSSTLRFSPWKASSVEAAAGVWQWQKMSSLLEDHRNEHVSPFEIPEGVRVKRPMFFEDFPAIDDANRGEGVDLLPLSALCPEASNFDIHKLYLADIPWP